MDLMKSSCFLSRNTPGCLNPDAALFKFASCSNSSKLTFLRAGTLILAAHGILLPGASLSMVGAERVGIGAEYCGMLRPKEAHCEDAIAITLILKNTIAFED